MHVCSTGHFYVYPIVPVLSSYVLRFEKKRLRKERSEGTTELVPIFSSAGR